ncbi:MerC domain-containing protein [Segetibacter koreensis]|uniref:MerC domain-containing protein n=1 Tax=Segetibacter koreensis TaxID=398037 RepID=UPI0003768E10|nr:MerC domain-containing protein [Segetibacter koreensis]
MNKNSKINWDALGIAASVACAIHCALLPLLFTSLPLFGINIIENKIFEIIMVIVAFAIGVYSLYHGWKKHHHNYIPLLVFSAGFILLVLKLFFDAYENWLLLPAVIGIVSAHMINFRACKIHNHAHADDCNH